MDHETEATRTSLMCRGLPAESETLCLCSQLVQMTFGKK
jgi:hypothetical protein